MRLNEGSDAERIVDFLSGPSSDDCGRDGRGRTLREIQAWPDERLESVHDYIQWMFPLPEPSPVNPEAPVLDRAVCEEIRSRPELQASLRESWLRMLRFYGFESHDDPQGGMKVERGAGWPERSRNWLCPGNHNHLRITRILKCLHLTGLEREASAFFDALAEIHAQERKKPVPAISARTYEFWRAAVGRE